MSRSQDLIIDDDEETCPLCIEEFDLSDRNFRPCPCGYQICQFCFNSLKTTYEKSTCPNCRRQYDDSTIQYKMPTSEELKMDQLKGVAAGDIYGALDHCDGSEGATKLVYL